MLMRIKCENANASLHKLRLGSLIGIQIIGTVLELCISWHTAIKFDRIWVLLFKPAAVVIQLFLWTRNILVGKAC